MKIPIQLQQPNAHKLAGQNAEGQGEWKEMIDVCQENMTSARYQPPAWNCRCTLEWGVILDTLYYLFIYLFYLYVCRSPSHGL